MILIGNLGADPEVRQVSSDAKVANFRIATSETYKDRQTGERREQTEWHNIVAWRGLAEITERYLRKGSKVYVEGKLRTRQWQDKEGNTRYTTEVHAEEMTMLDRANSGEGGSPAGPAMGAPRQAAQPIAGAPMASDPLDEVDDLPF